MKKIMWLTVGILLTGSVQAQVPANNRLLVEGRQQIEKLCGCFEVEFKYAETFSPDPAYKYRERDEISGGLELIMPVETSDKKVIMQHLLVINDSMIIKHWREDWAFEDPTIWKYNGNKVWAKEQLKPEQVKGKWTQSVWEVSDAPRYQGSAEWVNLDGKTFWQNTTDAPLPRREYTVRQDYNVLRRTNRLVITNDGWVHEQDNQKIIRTLSSDKLLVEEKGINSYRRVGDKQCAAAKTYWEKNKTYWTAVRHAWETYVAGHTRIELNTLVNGKPLHDGLFALAKEYAAGKVNSAELPSRIKSTMEPFFRHDEKAKLD